MLDTLPRGALAAPVGEAGEGWQKIALPDGREGYTKCSLWEDDYKTPPAVSEEALRARAVEVALSYQGTQYRWGGKSPLGVDCSGLTFMAWFFCGVSLYRDARLVDGFPARPIPFEARKPGDLLYFPGHIALYLGNDRYIHSTARAGSDGVVINSLDPAAPDYRADLREKLYAVGSVFPLA
ncbi:Dipeptidyl-peptidase 6 [Flavonifractor plautii]|uniref:Dipeptidyl-peptidase 6 n=1 Tax=Flavonifractor plautii TaxID=292800 RepID=A0A174VQY7_FLAPL|nr:Dipeptidyl-peptidase 6 [Flavonifractor plautii]